MACRLWEKPCHWMETIWMRSWDQWGLGWCDYPTNQLTLLSPLDTPAHSSAPSLSMKWRSNMHTKTLGCLVSAYFVWKWMTCTCTCTNNALAIITCLLTVFCHVSVMYSLSPCDGTTWSDLKRIGRNHKKPSWQKWYPHTLLHNAWLASSPDTTQLLYVFLSGNNTAGVAPPVVLSWIIYCWLKLMSVIPRLHLAFPIVPCPLLTPVDPPLSHVPYSLLLTH